ncbi:chalcone isomerase family protein [Desulfogranum mediterraneum]|uniref:chalcone isomerase family protein n=1 Tax=Desulfogranum mediterraneum TaxID=160661 RepID=UPI00041FB13A|nr:chalcone isomerase family protein [Desulfogranum mediterraneum]
MTTRAWLFSLLLLLTALDGLAAPPGMQLHGKASLYYLGFIRVYDVSLYTRGTVTAREILAPETSKCLRLDYNLSLTVEDIIQGENQVLSAQHSPLYLAGFQGALELIRQGYRDVAAGDDFTLCYHASSGQTTLSLNGRELVTVAAPAFAQLYFGIWLHPEEPLDRELRNRLLERHVP